MEAIKIIGSVLAFLLILYIAVRICSYAILKTKDDFKKKGGDDGV